MQTDVSTSECYFDFNALCLDLQTSVNRGRQALYDSEGEWQWHCLPPLINVTLKSSSCEVLGSRKLSLISMILHTSGRFHNEIEQKLRQRASTQESGALSEPLNLAELTEEDIPSTVFDALVDYMDAGNGAASLHSGDEPALIKAAAYIGMETLLDCMPRHMRWRHMSVEQIVTVLTTCLRFWPRAEFTQPALLALAAPGNLHQLAASEWQALLPVGEALMGLWPHPAHEFLGIRDDHVGQMQRGEVPPHQRVLLFLIAFAMVCSVDDANTDATASAEALTLLRNVANVVCPFPCPAISSMCDYALERATAGCAAAAEALRVLQAHFLARGVSPRAMPAQIVPLWAGDTLEWSDLPANRSVGIWLGPNKVRLLTRLSGPQLATDATGPLSDELVCIRTSCVAFQHDCGVHDFALELHRNCCDDFDRAHFALRRRCHAQTHDSVALFSVKLAVLSHRKSQQLLPCVTSEHLGAIHGAHFEDLGMRPARDAPGDEGCWTTSEECDMLWDHLCQTYVEPLLESAVCCVDVEVECPRSVRVQSL